MELTPEDLERAEFTSSNSGYDPDSVHELLRRAATRLRSLERDGVKSVSEAVSAVLDQAVKSGEELVVAAEKDADAIRSAAEADARRVTSDADAVAARAVAEGEQAAAAKREEAEGRAEEILAAAENDARDRSAKVISEVQQRLDRLLAAERDVHDRLQAAMNDIQASVSRVGVTQTVELALTVEDPAGDLHWAGEDATPASIDPEPGNREPGGSAAADRQSA